MSGYLCEDVRVGVEVECFPVKDDDAVVAISVRSLEDQRAIGAWLNREDAEGLARFLLDEIGARA